MQVVAVVAQPSEPVRRYIEETGLPFNILIDESRDVVRAYGVWHPVGVFSWNIARPALFLIDPTGAIRYSFIADRQDEFPTHEAILKALGNKRGIAECIAGLASLRARQGKLSFAAKMLGAAEALLGASGAAWWPADRVEVENTRTILQSALPGSEYKAAWAAGQAMSLDQAITLVSNEA